MTTYASFYHSSAGQPRNGYAEDTSKRAAIARARSLRDNLILCSGGRAMAVRLDLSPDGEEINEEVIYSWYEHLEGGFRQQI